MLHESDTFFFWESIKWYLTVKVLFLIMLDSYQILNDKSKGFWTLLWNLIQLNRKIFTSQCQGIVIGQYFVSRCVLDNEAAVQLYAKKRSCSVSSYGQVTESL